MSIFDCFTEDRKEKQIKINEECNNFIMQMDNAMQEVAYIFGNQMNFVDVSTENMLKCKYNGLLSYLNNNNFNYMKKAMNYGVFIHKRQEFLSNINFIRGRIDNHNRIVANNRIQNAYGLIGDVEGRKLDYQQMTCIVKEAYNHLVIAGAGTGKTTTIVGKIKYMLRSGKCKPEDILVLSFTNASASEMSERICKETGCNIDASTFHKLGLNIITKVDGITPKITQLKLRKFIKEQLQLNMQNQAYLHMLSMYLYYNRVVAKSEFEFSTQAEYNEYLQQNPPTTINNEIVKSYGEMDIANFLAQNGIRYIYENPYKYDTRTSEYQQYCPDFYLPDYDIYIEYFGINKDGEVPSYFSGKDGMTATQAYQMSMQWKRETHSKNGTIMIECYAYEKFDGVLLDKLKERLEEKSVKICPKTTQELWSNVSSDDVSIIDGVAELFETLINLIKSNGYSIATVRQLNGTGYYSYNNNIIISLIEPIFYAYCAYLKEHGEIDFNDMINTAIQYVNQQKYINTYKYVIVDEYQDMAKARFNLLLSLRKSNNYELFCVGDDWQSIYRFAGSDIGFILNFERYWGPTEISRIETTYRFTQKLIEISGGFVMQNPMQIRKYIKGRPDTFEFPLGEINGYTDNAAIEFLVDKLHDLPKDSSIFFIGRYSFDADLLKENKDLTLSYDNVNGMVSVRYNQRIDLKMNFITAHKSKGLQADYVFIINNKRSRMGFPSKIQDASILNLLLDNCDSYPYAEERRLYYVALTRAKKKAYMVTVSNQESEFALELKRVFGREINDDKYRCPECGGKLVKRQGPYGEFVGCANYRVHGCRYKRELLRKS